MNLDQMKTYKRMLGYSNETISRISGVPVATVRKVMSGTTKNPRQKTVEALEKALSKSTEDSYNASKPSIVRDGAAAYQTGSRRYTIEDIYALPEDVWAELIDGKLYYMAAPARTHQKITGEMYLAIATYIKSKGGTCEVYISPFGVYLFKDDSTYVLPDLVVVCDTSKLEEKGCLGAPDWVVEVVSPSSRKMDYVVKLEQYRRSGVREYWAVNSENRIVMIYRFAPGGGTEDVLLRSFDDKIESGVFPNLEICLADLV